MLLFEKLDAIATDTGIGDNNSVHCFTKHFCNCQSESLVWYVADLLECADLLK